VWKSIVKKRQNNKNKEIFSSSFSPWYHFQM
jgi:hypothetical protein